MILPRVLPLSKRLIEQTVLQGEVVVDATAGNGNDTKFLAEHVGEEGHVFAFDIQQQALDSTAERLQALTERVTLVLDSHAHVDKYVQAPIGGAMFNLGYLPYSDDLSIITKPDTTIEAIHKLLGLLKKDGMITIAVYDGHEGGKEEREALLQYVTKLHQVDVHVAKYELLNQLNKPPFLLAIEKLRDFDEPRMIEG
nr:class I SAM-dependent methyltransferase [Sporosarcina pasteurii]